MSVLPVGADSETEGRANQTKRNSQTPASSLRRPANRVGQRFRRSGSDRFRGEPRREEALPADVRRDPDGQDVSVSPAVRRPPDHDGERPLAPALHVLRSLEVLRLPVSPRLWRRTYASFTRPP